MHRSALVIGMALFGWTHGTKRTSADVIHSEYSDGVELSLVGWEWSRSPGFLTDFVAKGRKCLAGKPWEEAGTDIFISPPCPQRRSGL
jgi:hypothetical protein